MVGIAYWRKFIDFLERINKVRGSFYNLHYNDDGTFSFRFVPGDFDITRLTTIEKYCRIADIEMIQDDFFSDFARSEGYQDYHEITLKSNGYFGKKINKEMFE